jgi:hypothetical protein
VGRVRNEQLWYVWIVHVPDGQTVPDRWFPYTQLTPVEPRQAWHGRTYVTDPERALAVPRQPELDHDDTPMQRYPIDVGVHLVFSPRTDAAICWGWAIKWTKDIVCVHLDTEIHGYRRVRVAPSANARR